MINLLDVCKKHDEVMNHGGKLLLSIEVDGLLGHYPQIAEI